MSVYGQTEVSKWKSLRMVFGVVLFVPCHIQIISFTIGEVCVCERGNEIYYLYKISPLPQTPFILPALLTRA